MKWEKYPALKAYFTLIKLLGHKHLLVLMLIFTTILAGLDITVSYLVKRLLDSALGQDFLAFRNMVVLLCIITGILMLFRYLQGFYSGKYTEEGIATLRQRFVTHLLFMPVDEFEKFHSGDLISRMTNDMNRIKDFTNQSLLAVTYQPLAATGAFIYLLTLNWELTLVTTFIVPFIFKISARFSDPIARYTKLYQEELALVNKETQDTISGIEVVRSYGLESELGKKFNNYIAESVQAGFKVMYRKVMLQGITLFSNVSPFFICFGFGGYMVIRGQMTAGSLIAFITLLNPLTYPISRLPQLIGELKGQMVAASRVFEIFELPQERQDGENFLIVPGEPTVEFINVSFAYPDGEQVLNNVSFSIEIGENVALVGPSGGGKSTIFNLILGYYENYTGEINIFGRPLCEWNLRSLRARISLVAQETYLFPGTIEDNIALAKEGATRKEIIAAAKEADADEFIMEMRDCYRTDVGEFGDKLSGGQKQRISIARAILKGAPLFLLDEATSSLDTQTEAQVQKALDSLIDNGLTSTLLISHRLSTIQQADRILVLHHGQIVEEGTHEELIEKNGIYKTMVSRQTEDVDSPEALKEKGEAM